MSTNTETRTHLAGIPEASLIAKQVKAKKIVPALATVAETDCEIDTLEAKGVKVPAGSLVLSGVKGELWSPGDWFVIYGPGDFGCVADDIFKATYKTE